MSAGAAVKRRRGHMRKGSGRMGGGAQVQTSDKHSSNILGRYHGTDVHKKKMPWGSRDALQI